MSLVVTHIMVFTECLWVAFCTSLNSLLTLLLFRPFDPFKPLGRSSKGDRRNLEAIQYFNLKKEKKTLKKKSLLSLDRWPVVKEIDAFPSASIINSHLHKDNTETKNRN